MNIAPEGLSLIKDEETLRLSAYMCPGGKLTVGYGHTGDVYEGETITQDEAEVVLRRDVARFEACVARTCPNATVTQFSAMVSLAFNIGESAFARSSVARLHNAKRNSEAGQAFALWNKASGKVLPGLVRRRAREAALYLQDSSSLSPPPATADGEGELSESRVLNGQTVALAGTAGSVAVGAISNLPPADLSQILSQFLPYASGIKWLSIAIILCGIAYAMYARIHDRHTGRS